MSNLDPAPDELLCDGGERHAGIEILEPRSVPLGGPRAMDVRRTLPQRQRSLIGAWCFLDHYGPDRVASSGGMQVPRHPHTGLQTVSWLFTGEIEHTDSAGHEAIVRPGELNLMTAGRGITHSEFSTPDTDVLHGAQLWTALPDAARHTAPDFEHYRPEPVSGDGWVMRVFLGALGGGVSPVRTHTPLVGAELLLEPGTEWNLHVDPDHEHGILLDAGDLTVDGRPVARDHLAYLPTGRTGVVLAAGTQTAVRALLIGGEPLGEQIVMWWNFVGRSHDEVVAYRAAYQAEIGREPALPTAAGALPEESGLYDDGAPFPRFGPFPDGRAPALPAPVLPQVRMRPRG